MLPRLVITQLLKTTQIHTSLITKRNMATSHTKRGEDIIIEIWLNIMIGQ